MAVETTGTDKICRKCGADVRPHALFCYSCGSSVAADDGQLFAANKPIAKPVLEEIAEPLDKSFDDLSSAKNKEVEEAEVTDRKIVVEKETVLKTAAAVRRQTKPPRRKNVEIVWEQPPDSVNVWFLATAFILALFAVGALLAMLYLH